MLWWFFVIVSALCLSDLRLMSLSCVSVFVQDLQVSVWTSWRGNCWSLTLSTSVWLSHVSSLVSLRWSRTLCLCMCLVKSSLGWASSSRFHLSSNLSSLVISPFLSVCMCLSCACVCVCVLYIVSPISSLPDHSFRSAIYWQIDSVWPSPHGAHRFISPADGLWDVRKQLWTVKLAPKNPKWPMKTNEEAESLCASARSVKCYFLMKLKYPSGCLVGLIFHKIESIKILP